MKGGVAMGFGEGEKLGTVVKREAIVVEGADLVVVVEADGDIDVVVMLVGTELGGRGIGCDEVVGVDAREVVAYEVFVGVDGLDGATGWHQGYCQQ